ncbi:phospholipase D-like domain-containing protein [Burkholderia cenocepacia]|uniref:phospholipase D-like domain-containing protein n=1 Tax=Burkholderia cenocepacia TaxID=95486 RepID=UPI0022325D56|nr:phospholipase D-like domain-containing protein [Burkholderia cenocepacia]MCW5182373.1 phospholipase D-like domain-containing protein [Burkholderia cenocepacia]
MIHFHGMRRRWSSPIVAAAMFAGAVQSASAVDVLGWAVRAAKFDARGVQSASVTSDGSGSCRVDVGFAPDGAAARLVDAAIDGARTSVKVAAYAFTSTEIARRLAAAQARGVKVEMLVDARETRDLSAKGYASRALQTVLQAGIPVRAVSAYKTSHDKYMVVDNESIETGSFNYTSAATKNSENALWIASCPSIAQAFMRHWQSRWDQGVALGRAD